MRMHKVLEWETEEDAQKALRQMGVGGERNYWHVIDIATEPDAREKAFALQLLGQKVATDWKVLTSSIRWNVFSGQLGPDQEKEWQSLLTSQTSSGMLVVSSFCRNGRYREDAVSALAEWDDERAIPLLILRSCDWVPKIANVASRLALRKIKSASVEGLADSLRSLIVQERVLSAKDPRVVARFQAAIFGREGVLAQMRRTATPKEQGWLFQHNLRLPGETLDGQIVSLLRLKDPSVVLLGLRHLRLQPVEEQLGQLDNLAASKVPEARELAVDLADQHDDVKLLNEAIFDSHWRVRGRARISLEKREVKDFAALYRLRFPDPSAISGFGEVASGRDLEELLPLVDHPDYRVRRAAIRVLGNHRLDVAAASTLRHLEDENPSVIRAAALAVGKLNVRFSIDEIERLYASSVDSELVLHAKSFTLRQTNHWDRFYLLLKLMREGKLRKPCNDMMRLWLCESRMITLGPTKEQLDRAKDELIKSGPLLFMSMVKTLEVELEHWSSRLR
ncbi:MAG TPA: HEAT repeat domain-containing protein [Fimbriimonadaceae bacterium]|jgi:HEAT repeat protein